MEEWYYRLMFDSGVQPQRTITITIKIKVRYKTMQLEVLASSTSVYLVTATNQSFGLVRMTDQTPRTELNAYLVRVVRTAVPHLELHADRASDSSTKQHTHPQHPPGCRYSDAHR
jgi:hypothetical protein